MPGQQRFTVVRAGPPLVHRSAAGEPSALGPGVPIFGARHTSSVAFHFHRRCDRCACAVLSRVVLSRFLSLLLLLVVGPRYFNISLFLPVSVAGLGPWHLGHDLRAPLPTTQILLLEFLGNGSPKPCLPPLGWRYLCSLKPSHRANVMPLSGLWRRPLPWTVIWARSGRGCRPLHGQPPQGATPVGSQQCPCPSGCTSRRLSPGHRVGWEEVKALCPVVPSVSLSACLPTSWLVGAHPHLPASRVPAVTAVRFGRRSFGRWAL
jgi:hypothetical protein